MLDFTQRSVLRADDPAPAGGDPAPAPAFDPAAFETSLLGKIDKMIGGLDKRYKKDIETLKANAKPPADPIPADGHQDQPAGEQPKGAPPVDPRIKQMERDLADLRKANESEKTAREQERVGRRNAERDSKVQGVLNQFQFADETSAKDAFKLAKDQIKWSEDGEQLIGPDDLPFETYIKDFIGARKNLLASRDVGGAGARGGNGRSGARRWSLEDLEPATFNKLKPEEQKELSAHIGSQVANSQMGH